MLIWFYGLLAGASDPARKMSEIVNVLVRGGTACENLFQSFEVEKQISKPDHPIPVPLHSERVEFEQVVFAYRPREPVLRNVCLQVPFGQTVAIVGGNGSGKSTLMNLLARFYDPHQGRILIDGHDIRQMNPRKLRSQMAWVTQDSVLFNTTVWENIAYGRSHATEAEVLAAAQLARVDQFADQLPSGYQTVVGEDGRLLSAGQCQRIALARAILANPRILILDEATSQMDGQTEKLIHQALLPFIKQRTTFVVTHRRSSLALADRVVVMRQGKIVLDSSVADASQSGEFQTLFAKSA
jgi:ATP-binding cassette subfamily B protein/subfamily B ATP-binding cassette protein MsbA